MLPISTAKQKVLGTNKANAKAVSTLIVQAIGPETMDQALQEMTALLRERHRIQAGQEDDFTVNNVALYNFLSTFSGTHFLQPRTLVGRFGIVF